jgi:hypothetical protein
MTSMSSGFHKRTFDSLSRPFNAVRVQALCRFSQGALCVLPCVSPHLQRRSTQHSCEQSGHKLHCNAALLPAKFLQGCHQASLSGSIRQPSYRHPIGPASPALGRPSRTGLRVQPSRHFLVLPPDFLPPDSCFRQEICTAQLVAASRTSRRTV